MRVYIYCFSIYGISALKILQRNNYNVVCFIDDDDSLKNKSVQNIGVLNSDIVQSMSHNELTNVAVVVCNQAEIVYDHILMKLKPYGFEDNQIIHLKY